ncbi:MAG: tyrosine-type recombinase/integrase [Kiritimatiellae bacterium]|nr:tyrosine-type recombinase/integrase [Kiritimatiellia bacterium]
MNETTKKADAKRWTEAGFSITYRADRKRYQVRLKQSNGKRRFKLFATLGEARQECREQSTRLQNEGTEALSLTTEQRIDATKALGLLGDGVTLEDSATFYRKHFPANGSTSISDAINEYLAAPGRRGKKSVERRKATVDGASWRLKAFSAAFPAAMIHDISSNDITDWLNGGGWTGINRKHYLANVRALYSFACRKGYIEYNPADDVDSVDVPDSDPDILTPEEIEKILNAAREHIPEMLPRLALSYFCGIRPEELSRLTWDKISVANKLVSIDGDVAKVQGHRRNIELSENALAWLAICWQDKGRVWPYNSQTTLVKKRKALRAASGVTCPGNAGRHAFASYHLVMHQNAPHTAELMGHSDIKLLRNTYRNIQTHDGETITKARAARFWAISPAHEEGVLRFSRAG